jgi:DNA-binding transcriptional MocR family regulator
MNSGPTAERVYEALKRQITSRAFRPGDRLDPAALAEALSSSVTPVRDALHLLTGEGLVATGTGEGFHLPLLDQPALSDLYAWTSEVLVLAVRAWRASPDEGHRPSLAGLNAADFPKRTGKLFAAVAERSDNAEHARAVASLNDCLHAARMVEPQILGGIAAELEAIEAALASSDRNLLRKQIAAYHRRRRRQAAQIVRAIYRAD